MSNHGAPTDGDTQDANGPAVVSLGNKMPGSSRKLPVLGSTSREGDASQRTDDPSQPRSEIAEGLSFTGNAVINGVCTVKGRVEGNLEQAEGSRTAVIVTETGFVKGDILADQISIMGRTEGLLDATGGSVSLHDSANVSGHVRYFRIQVNGSELNATLERSPGKAALPGKAASPTTRGFNAPPAPSVVPLADAGSSGKDGNVAGGDASDEAAANGHGGQS